MRLARLQGLGGDADEGGAAELRRRPAAAAAAAGGDEAGAPAGDEAELIVDAAEVARADKAAKERKERDEKLRRRVAELNAEAEAKEENPRQQRLAREAKAKANKAAAAAAATPALAPKQQRSPAPATKKPSPSPAKAADVPMGKVAHMLGAKLDVDGPASGHLTALKAALVASVAAQNSQGGAALQLRFIAFTQRTVDVEKRSAKQSGNALHTQVCEEFEGVLAEVLLGVVQGMPTGDDDDLYTDNSDEVLLNNLTSDAALPPQLLGAALENLGDLDAAWARVQGTFNQLWAAIRGPADAALCERIAGIDSPTSSLSAMVALMSVPVVVRAMAANIGKAPWIPQRRADPMPPRKLRVVGSDIEMVFLGPLFGLGIVPDAVRKLRNPMHQRTAWNAGKIGEFFFPDGFRRRQVEIDADVEMAREQVHVVQDQLVRMTKSLLRKDRGSREHMLEWLHHAVESNANKAKVYSDHTNDSSDNFAFNIAYVLLQLCQPLMTGKVAPVIQSEFGVRCARYVENPDHQCSYEGETKFACETAELDSWVDSRNLARIKQFAAAKKKAAAEEAGGGSGTAHMNGTVHSQEESAAAGDDDASDEDAMDALMREEEPEPESEQPAAATMTATGGGGAAAPQQTFSFVTEIFFLTARALHHGFIPSMNLSERNQPQSASTYYQLMHAMNPLAKIMNELAGQRHPEAEAMYGQMFATKLCYDATMLDPRFLTLTLKFYAMASRWLIKLACGIDETSEGEEVDLSELELPLKSPAPMAFAMLPEHFLTDTCEFLSLTAEFKGSVLFSASAEFDRILSLLVILLESPGYVRNPHLRMKFVAVITLLLPPKAPKRGSDEELPDFSDIFNHNVISKRYLPQSLIRLYVDIENTGSHNQFHEKVGPRNNVYRILEHLCDPDGSAARATQDGTSVLHPPDPVYRASLFSYLTEGSELAKKFMSMLLGDTQLHFDDGLSNLATAKKLQEEEDSGQWEGLPASTEPQGAPSVGSLEEKKKELEDAENTARHWIGQTSRTMRFLAYVTKGCCEPFLAGVFVQRMAQMLNSMIGRLAGSKMGELKVKDMDALAFRPIELLEEVASVFVNLHTGSLVAAAGEGGSFVAAMIGMGQYDPAVYAKAVRIISCKFNLRSLFLCTYMHAESCLGAAVRRSKREEQQRIHRTCEADRCCGRCGRGGYRR